MAVRIAWSLSLLVIVHATAAASKSAARIWPRQYADTPLSTPECIEKSLSNPSWYIVSPMMVTVNASTGGTIGDLQFLATNTATGSTALCDKRDFDLDPHDPVAQDEWHSCNVTDLAFQFRLAAFEMRLKGSWRCGANSSFIFSGGGPWEEPLVQGCIDNDQGKRGEETLCIMGNSQVSAALTSPVAITPQLPILPYTPSETYRRCPDRSTDPEWIIDKFAFQHHLSRVYNATKESFDLFLNLTSISSNETVPCSIAVDQRTGAAAKGTSLWVKCRETPRNGSRISETEVMLDPEYGILGVRQAWNCTDRIEGIDPDKYSGTGFLVTSLQCGSPMNVTLRDSQNREIGIKTDYNCTLPPSPSGDPIRFSGYSPEAPTMPHTLYSRSCTIGSLLNATSIDLRDYRIQSTTFTPGYNKTGVLVLGTFNLTNPGSGDTYQLEQIPISPDGLWHECVPGAERGLPWQLVDCQYLLDRKAGRIGFKLQWYCDDRDPNHAILFNATATANLPIETCGKIFESPPSEICTLRDALKLPVVSLTWEASSGPMDRGPILPWL
ncbi:hypothetical protein QBC47DRAFT_392060 [Echria macrotheca]|uniref:AA1-like domain-containing protein n=1 Tax=Echria macrotheca TaxID=438768 RepID=A0AAJ0F2D1_9PEZI|nr:hypothetical protein QBC47DRAFT_392060 [Echria macrotheca]